MHVTRRTLLGAALAAAATSVSTGSSTLAQDASPVSGQADRPGYGIARIRTHASAELAQAVYADVLTQFLPPTAAVPGYVGYIFAFDIADPSTTINVTLLADEGAAESANVVAQEYVKGMDERLVPETPVADQGVVRIFEMTDRPRSDIPPLLNGCHITMRRRTNAPETDIEAVITAAAEGFVPIVQAMDGFVLYCWLHTDEGRVSFNIWETEAHLQAGNEAVATFVAENPVITESGESLVYNGVIGYSDLLGRN
jgi:hypothetical protein